MANPSNHIAAAAASIALVGAFGAGAFALSQTDGEFDPKNFASAYAQGANDAQKGYQANPSDTDANANRHDNGDEDKSAGDSSKETDTVNNLPTSGESGTTALRVSADGNANSNLAAGSGNGDGSQDGTGDGATGPVIDPSVIGGGDKDNAGNGDSGNNGGKDDANNGGGGTNNGGNGGTSGGYDVLPTDPTPSKDSSNSSDYPVFPVNHDGITDDYEPSDINVSIFINNSGPYGYNIYQGQSLDAWSLFCIIDARFTLGYGWDAPMYEWICSSKEEFDSYPYFKITDFPDVAPSEPFDIKVAYRFNSNGEWQEKTLTVTPQESCTFIVSTALDENGSPIVLAQPKYQQEINLWEYTDKAIESLDAINDYGNQTEIILNWKEDGKVVESPYTPTAGRHVIQIGDTAPVPDGCTVSCWTRYLDKLYSLQNLSSVEQGSSLYSWNENDELVLEVPEGIQSINPSQSYYNPIYANEINVPASVRYIEALDDGLIITNRYSVSSENPWYASTDSGVLTNKEGDQYLGIPSSINALDIPENITSIALSWNNTLDNITLEAKTADQLPAISWGGKSNTNVVVNDSLLRDFIAANASDLAQETGNTVSLQSSPEQKYYCQGCLIRSDSDLIGIMDNGETSITIDSPLTWKAGTFEGSSATQIAINGDFDLNLEDGCLTNSNIQEIKCVTQEQKEYIEQRLAAAGAPDVTVSLMDVSQEGYSYFVSGDEVTILSAPQNIKEFTGIITTTEGEQLKATSLAPDLFAGSKTLEWVNLDESVATIGARAFYGCPNLQGVFISNTGYISVGADAYTDCENLRFAASCALGATFESNTSTLNQQCKQWCLDGSYGYPGDWNNYFSYFPGTIVNSYSLCKTCEGNYTLYGCLDGNPWLLIGSGNTVPEGSKLTLEKSTEEIYIGAFEKVSSSFSVNWEDLENLAYVDSDAFGQSGLTGDVVVGKNSLNAEIGDGAFAYCNISSFACPSDYLMVGGYAFIYSKNLESVSIAAGATDNPDELPSFLSPNCFDGCDKLSSVEFANSKPIQLDLASGNKRAPFMFNNELSFEEEATKIKLKIPEEYQQTYIQEWAIKFYGLTDYESLYHNAYNKVYENSDYATKPTWEQTRNEMRAELLIGENHMRTMMGIPTVTETTVVLPDPYNGAGPSDDEVTVNEQATETGNEANNAEDAAKLDDVQDGTGGDSDNNGSASDNKDAVKPGEPSDGDSSSSGSSADNDSTANSDSNNSNANADDSARNEAAETDMQADSAE